MIAEVVSSDTPIPDEYKGLEQEVSALESRVQVIQILTDDGHGQACELERELAKQDAAIIAKFSPAKTAAHKAHKEICDLETLLRRPIDAARRMLKQKIGLFREARQAEVRRLEAATREAANRQAEAEALARAQHHQDRGDAARADAVIASYQAPAIVVAVPKLDAKGTRTPKTWSAEVHDKLALIAWVAQAPAERHVFLEANSSALNSQAKTFKESLSIPGVRPVSRFS